VNNSTRKTTSAEQILDEQILVSTSTFARLTGLEPGTIRTQIRRGEFPLDVIRPAGPGTKAYVRSADVRRLINVKVA
jgi:hypothetical protein